MKPKITLKFEPRDMWVGLYWRYSPQEPDDAYDYSMLTVYVCLVPMLPIILHWEWGKAE